MQRFVILGLMCLCGVPPGGRLNAADGERQIARARDAFQGGRYAEADGLYASAIRQEEAAGAAIEKTARALYELGTVRRIEGRCDEATDLIRRGIRMLSAAPHPDPEELSRLWQTLADAYRCRARHLDALHAYSQAWDLEAGVPAPDRQRLVDILSGQVVNYLSLGRHDESEAAFARIQALADEKRLEPLQQAAILNNLGTLRRLEGRLPEAEAAFRQGLLQVENNAATADPTAVYLSSNLGMLVLERKAYQEAKSLFARSMSLIEAGAEVPPEDLPQLLRNYAVCLQKMGQKGEARKLLARAGTLEREFPSDRLPRAPVSVDELVRAR